MVTMYILLFLLSTYFHNTLSASYIGSRRIYTKTSSGALCADYVEVEFRFSDTDNTTDIKIISSNTANWFAIGFPPPTNYYDKTVNLMESYSIVYINGSISEYNIQGNDVCNTTQITDCYTEQLLQNINTYNTSTNTEITVHLNRDIITPDPEDFAFEIDFYKQCYPLLITVAVGSDAQLTSTHTYGSSYVYLYDVTDLLDTSSYSTNADLFLPKYGADEAENAILNVTFDMDPSTSKVSVTVTDNNTDARAWGISLPDYADTAYYATNPIDMVTDYSVMWGASVDAVDCSSDHQFVQEATLIDSTICLDSTNTPTPVPTPLARGAACWSALPVQSSTSFVNNFIDGKYEYTFDLDFQSCGYEFNPYEFKTCRPLTIVGAAITTNHDCWILAATNEYHQYDIMQIDDFPTRAPSKTPSLAPTGTPSQPPSIAPSWLPTAAPVNPTASPTEPTNIPSNAPSQTPTAKPTDLPTANLTDIDEPPCLGMQVKHLDRVFPLYQSNERFNQEIGIVHNRRRIWTNGILEIYFEDRFEDSGDWIITNGSYSMISIFDANDNNLYNTSNNFVYNNSLPGPWPSGFIYYDHFPHDNIVSKPDREVTLFFQCFNESTYPTSDPTPTPTTAQPTRSPTSLEPTMAPTDNCTALCLNIVVGTDTCTGRLAADFAGCYIKQGTDIAGKPTWEGVNHNSYGDVLDFVLYYNEFFEQWVIDGIYGHSAMSDNNDNRLYPPENETWNIIEEENPLKPDCEAVYQYSCSGTGLPTKAPTATPTTATPTTEQPSQDPSFTPSNAPSVAPSMDPTLTPTNAPTSSPVSECKGFNITGTDYLDGLYRREETQRAGRDWWKALDHDGEIFWSDSVLHDSWIVYTNVYQRYWLSQSKPISQPPIISLWDLYLGASPFIDETRELNLNCLATLPPTRAPTLAPSVAPSITPSFMPSQTPTQPPSISPSSAPTNKPTEAPTTLPPTLEPTIEPTYQPTQDPTPEDCDFLVITAPYFDAKLLEYVGSYEFVLDGLWRSQFTPQHQVYSSGGSTEWILDVFGESYQLIMDGGSTLRPPYFGTSWQFTNDNPKVNYTLFIDCSDSESPTIAPSIAPSISPTQSPTSSCFGLYFNNSYNNYSYEYNGWFNRMNDYTVNDHIWWVSNNHAATIEYINGYWYLLEKDNDKSDDEDPLMLTEYGHDLLSPPSGIWKYYGHVGKSSYVDIICDSTMSPTTYPTLTPSDAPTDYTPFTWEECPDTQLYFNFVADMTQAYSIYWPVPTVDNEQHLYNINITSIPSYEPGDELPIGEHTITYYASDTYGTIISCNVSLIIIDSIKYNSFKFCKKEKFHIEIRINSSYYEISNGDSISVDSEEEITTIQGTVYDPSLIDDNQNCYVTAEQVTNYDEANVIIDESSEFLGISANDIVWEVLAFLLILCLFCLIIDCFYRLYKDRKDKKEADEKQLSLLAEEDQQDLAAEPAPNNNGNNDRDQMQDSSDNDNDDDVGDGGVANTGDPVINTGNDDLDDDLDDNPVINAGADIEMQPPKMASPDDDPPNMASPDDD